MSDYQIYSLKNGQLAGVGERMLAKQRAIPIPDLKGKSVLDVGCDHGFWCWVSILKGASRVVGVDRNREVRGRGFVNLIEENSQKARENGFNCEFIEMNLGKQWRDVGKFDVVYLFSLYHHIYQNTGGDHKSIWYWLRRQMKFGSVLLWENPVDYTDQVVKMNVDKDLWNDYTRDNILDSAGEYFDYEYIGPALHEPTREVWKFTAKEDRRARLLGFVEKGEGGARKAFSYNDGARKHELSRALGFIPYAGSLNIRTALDFPWDENYFRGQIGDVKDRSKGLDSEWCQKWMRFYPCKVNGEEAVAIRFEGEEYSKNFVEVVSQNRLDIPNLCVYKEVKSEWTHKATGEPAITVEIELTK